MIRAPSIRISGTLLLAAAVTGACDAGAERSGADVRFDTVGAVLHVTSGSRPEWNEGEAWTVPDSGTTIGALEGPPELVFGEVSGVAVDTAGRIWVADEQAKELRVFGPDGAFIRRVGREGEGPGEFRNLSGLVPAPGGIAALDGQLARVTVFAGDGSVLRSFRIQRPYMIFEHGAAIAFDRAGRFFDRAHLSTHPPVDTIGVITYSAAGDPVDTAVVGVVEQNHLTIERNGRPYMSFPRPYAPRPSFAFGPEGRVFFARGDAYRVVALGPDGDTLRVIHRDVPARPVTAAEHESGRRAVAARYEEVGSRLPPGLELPATHPVVEALRVATTGHLWVLTGTGEDAGTMEWAVHDPTGRWLGNVTTPAMNVMAIGDDYVVGVATDELGVGRVKVLPIRK